MSLSSTKVISVTSRSTSLGEKTTSDIFATTINLTLQAPTALSTPEPNTQPSSNESFMVFIAEIWSKSVVKIAVLAGGSLIILSIILCITLKCCKKKPKKSHIKDISEPEMFEYANHLARYDTTTRRTKYEDTIVNQEVSNSDSDYLDYDRTSDIFERSTHYFSREIPDNDLMDLNSISTDESATEDYIEPYGVNRSSIYSEISAWQSPRISHHEPIRSNTQPTNQIGPVQQLPQIPPAPTNPVVQYVQPTPPPVQVQPTLPIIPAEPTLPQLPTNNYQNPPTPPSVPTTNELLIEITTNELNPKVTTENLLPVTANVNVLPSTVQLWTPPLPVTTAIVITTNPIKVLPTTTEVLTTANIITTNLNTLALTTNLLTAALTTNLLTTSLLPIPTSAFPTSLLQFTTQITSVAQDSSSFAESLISTGSDTLSVSMTFSSFPSNTSVVETDNSSATADTIRLGLIIGACAIFLAALGIFAFRTISLRASDKFKSRLDDSLDTSEFDSAPFPKRSAIPKDAFPSTARENGSYFSADSTPRPSVEYAPSPNAYSSTIPQTMFDYGKYQYRNVYADGSLRPSYDYTSNSSVSPRPTGNDLISSAPLASTGSYAGYVKSGPYAPSGGNLSPNYLANAPSSSAPGPGKGNFGPQASNSSPNSANFAPPDNLVTPRSSFTFPSVFAGAHHTLHNPAYNWKGVDQTHKYYNQTGDISLYNSCSPEPQENAEIPLLDESEKAEIPLFIRKNEQQQAESSLATYPEKDDQEARTKTLDMPPIMNRKK
ncbi:hypothetical protein HDV06_005992 [Boothiomyces sp. JEL0866]|nr:hypothetical protein HDV06_005992 [Boothiomyces sp. JEL0866]